MHLGLTEPNIWYMADLQRGRRAITPPGSRLPGMPFVIAGHNEHVAWGFTALYADVQDLYIEKLDGKGNYQAADKAPGSRLAWTTKSFTCVAARM
jgi:penicillin amidase